MSGTVLYLHQQQQQPVQFQRFRPCAPDLQHLQDLCRGLCLTWTREAPARLGAPLPAQALDQISLGLRRSVDGFRRVSVAVLPERWVVRLETTDNVDVFAFEFSVGPEWVCLEKPQV